MTQVLGALRSDMRTTIGLATTWKPKRKGQLFLSDLRSLKENTELIAYVNGINKPKTPTPIQFIKINS